MYIISFDNLSVSFFASFLCFFLPSFFLFFLFFLKYYKFKCFIRFYREEIDVMFASQTNIIIIIIIIIITGHFL